MSKVEHLNNEQYFLILKYLETTTNKCDEISFEKNGEIFAPSLCPFERWWLTEGGGSSPPPLAPASQTLT